MCKNISDIAIITVKGADYHCIILDISKSDATNLLENSCLMILDIYKMHFKEINIKNRVYNSYFDNLIKAKNLETKTTLTNEKNYLFG